MSSGVKQKNRILCLKPTTSDVGHSELLNSRILNSYDPPCLTLTRMLL